MCLVEISRQRPQCNAISHRANVIKIADSFVCMRERERDTSKMAGLLESLLINMASSEDVLHLNCLIV